MRIAVTGATGRLGEFLIPALVADGHEVHALWHTRSENLQKFDAHAQLRWFQGDLRDLASLAELVDGCDAVVHAALEHVKGRYRGGEGDDPARFRTVNQTQTDSFLQSLQHTSVKRTVFISSRAVFDGYTEGTEAIGDCAKPRPRSLYGTIKANTERFGDTLDGIGFCTLRPTGIYGETSHLTDNKWHDVLTAGYSVTNDTEEAHQLRTEVHGEDVAQAILLLLSAPLSAVEHRHFNCSDIAVSRAQLLAFVTQSKRGEKVAFESLPSGLPPVNPMRCDELRELGWQPGGIRKLELSLRQMVEARS